MGNNDNVNTAMVSTRSRPKAAGIPAVLVNLRISRFNTQPPEGGWYQLPLSKQPIKSFQHAAARRRLGRPHHFSQRAASFNTQPPEGGWLF